ncbi:MAG TPA: DinB family protein [Dehalococcoidia bacterium]|nr:DinB family protein [Dehalococcoidia bacterium]
MSKGQEIADRFEEINKEFISVVEGLPEDRWRSKAHDEDRPINVIAYHVASSHSQIAGMVKTIAEGGQLPPVTWEMIDQGNAAQAEQIAGAQKVETLDLLRTGGQEAVAVLRSLSDEQLAKTGSTPAFGEQPWTAEQIAERVLLGHPQTHLASIKGS